MAASNDFKGEGENRSGISYRATILLGDILFFDLKLQDLPSYKGSTRAQLSSMSELKGNFGSLLDRCVSEQHGRPVIPRRNHLMLHATHPREEKEVSYLSARLSLS